MVLVDAFDGFSLVVVAAGSCDRSFRARLLPNLSFARHHSRLGEQLYRVAADADVSCAIPHRMGHSILCNVRLAPSVYWLAVTASKVTFELAQAGGTSSRAGRLGSNNLRQIGLRVSFLSFIWSLL